MKKKINIILILIIFIFTACPPVFAFSTRHHIINIGKGLFKICAAPIYGLLVKGPRDIKEIYRYEVYGSEDPKKNGLLIKKLFAIWSAPPAELKALIDGGIEGITGAGDAVKNLVSIVSSD